MTPAPPVDDELEEVAKGGDDRGRVGRSVRALLIILSVAVFVFSALIAIDHIDDRFQVDWSGGARLGLAEWAERGVVYPPLFDGEHYGGTRYMPIPFVLHGALADLSGHILASGKALNLLYMSLLLALTFLILRRMGAPTFVSLALVATILSTKVGIQQLAGIREDALAAFLQLSALFIIWRSRRRAATASAGALAAIALFTKLTAVWGVAAIFVFLVITDRRRLALFVGTWAAFAAGMFVVFQFWSDGRMLENLRELSFAGIGESSPVRPLRVLLLLVQEAPAVWPLVPLAVLEIVLQLRRREIKIFQLGFLLHLPVLYVMFSTTGVTFGHLIDLMVLTVVSTGALWTRVARREGWLGTTGLAISLLVVWAIASSAVVGAERQGVSALSPAPGLPQPADSKSTATIEDYLEPTDKILSEDPGLAVARGQLPVVLDPFMFLRLGEKRPELVRHLVGRIERQEFDWIVLLYRPDTQYGQWWYSNYNFGIRPIAAINQRYRAVEQVGRFFLYSPVEREEPALPMPTAGGGGRYVDGGGTPSV